MAIYLGTATPSDYKLGSNAVSTIYLGTTQVWPVASAALLTITRDNNSGASTFTPTGTGNSANLFTRDALIYHDDADGLSHYKWTVNGPCTISIQWTYSDDDDNGYGSSITKGGVRQVISTTPGQNPNQSTVTPGLYRSQNNINGSFSATTGDILRFTTEITYSQMFSFIRISAA